VGQNLNIANTPFKRYKYLGITVTNQNYFNEKFSSRLTSGTGCGTQLRNIILSTATNTFYLPFFMNIKHLSQKEYVTCRWKKLQMRGFKNCTLIKYFWKIKSIGYEGPRMFYVQA
jgi:hypothetical protein